ncbi:hypothetical protein DFR47_11211 [Pseudochrobactrum asaccharolyticum]|uniref:Uncharacterized protein n=1 Tax=Pseudochrobactrum asaccharolyticum TaxID=354351 RepID=A0A366DKE2_9HYPH|nr:hypothetical protein DFR47_11211 [Pseudochrobactrum asaccharolyticum]
MNMNLGDIRLLIEAGLNHTVQITSFGRCYNPQQLDCLVRNVPPNY